MRSDFSLIDANGKRKYLVEAEREAFLSAANRLPPRERAFCLTLEATGGRISEVLALQKRHIDRASGEIVIQFLRRGNPGLQAGEEAPPFLCCSTY
jgi:integrase/recombinase XerD